MSLKDYLRIFKRHYRWIFAWIAVIYGGYTFYDMFVKEVKFVSTAELTVKVIQTDGDATKKDKASGGSSSLMIKAMELGNRSDTLRSETVLKMAYRNYMELANLNKKFLTEDQTALWQEPYPVFEHNPPRKEDLELFSKCYRYNIVAGANRIQLTAESTNKYKAQWILESVVDAFKKYDLDTATNTFQNLLDEHKKKRDATEEAIKNYSFQKKQKNDNLKKKYGSSIVWMEGTERKQKDRDDTVRSIDDTEKEILSLQSELEDYKSFDPERWLVDDGENSKIVELQNQLYAEREKLIQELEVLRVDFTDKHPKVLKKMAELNSLNQRFPKLAEEIVQNRIREIERGLQNKRAYREKLLKDLNNINAVIGIIEENKTSFEEIDQSMKRANEELSRLSEDISHLNNLIVQQKDQISEFAKPKIGERPASDYKIYYYIGILGLIFGTAFGFMLEYMDETIRTVYDVEKFVGLRVLGTVPLIGKGEEKLLHRIALKSPISEMMNTLAMVLQAYMLRMKGQVLLIVSSKPGEGKSTFITNLAVALCRGGEKVVLIDSDLRKPSLHRFFGIDNSVGFSNYLEDAFSDDVEDSDEAKIAKIVHHTDVDGLFVIPSGPVPSNPVGLLKGENVERLLNHLKTYIGTILVDSPPLAMIDAGVLATKVSAVVTVVDAGKVSKREALTGKRLLENVGGNNIGVILNKVTLEGEEYYYYFEGYSYYYGSSRSRRRGPN